jgi:hypothetical protein
MEALDASEAGLHGAATHKTFIFILEIFLLLDFTDVVI